MLRSDGAARWASGAGPAPLGRLPEPVPRLGRSGPGGRVLHLPRPSALLRLGLGSRRGHCLRVPRSSPCSSGVWRLASRRLPLVSLAAGPTSKQGLQSVGLQTGQAGVEQSRSLARGRMEAGRVRGEKWLTTVARGGRWRLNDAHELPEGLGVRGRPAGRPLARERAPVRAEMLFSASQSAHKALRKGHQ